MNMFIEVFEPGHADIKSNARFFVSGPGWHQFDIRTKIRYHCPAG